MESVILVVHVITALSIIGLVLLQHGKGADMGAAFGSGSAGSVFGSSGSANFLSRTTAVLATIFFISSISLTIVSSKKNVDKGIMNQPAQQSAPAESLPSQIPAPPASAPAAAVPVPPAPTLSAPAADSKAGGVPK